MTKVRMIWLASLTTLVLVGMLLAGCSTDFAPTLPSPDGEPPPESTGVRSFVLTAGEDIIVGALETEFTIYEAAAEGEPFSNRPLTCFVDNTAGGAVAHISLVIDRSGSMGSSINGITRMEATKDAATLFVGLINPNDLVELIQFDSSVDVLVAFTSDQGVLTTAIAGITTGGTTAAWDAAKQGVDDLIAAGFVGGSVVLLTDGYDNASSISESGLITAATNAGIVIYTVALGTGVDTAALTNIATSTGGTFYQADTPSELNQAFQDILANVQAGGSYEICWDSQYDPGTVIWVKIVYKEGTPDEQVAYEGPATVVER